MCNLLDQHLSNKLLVSAVIPTYNSEKTIIKCLDSILNQTLKVYEILVIDDGSTDNTVEIVSNYITTHNLFTTQLFRQPNSGPSAARNLGIKHSKGHLIAFLDSDDEWLPSKTKEQIGLFKKYGKSICLTACLTSHSKKINSDRDIVNVGFNDLLWRNYFSTPTVMIWKDVLERNAFNINQKYSEDYNLWLRLSTQQNIMLINKILVKLADKPVFGHTGLSAKLWEMEKGELSNYLTLFNQKYIKWYQYCFFCALSFAKFLIRSIVSFKRRNF